MSLVHILFATAVLFAVTSAREATTPYQRLVRVIASKLAARAAVLKARQTNTAQDAASVPCLAANTQCYYMTPGNAGKKFCIDCCYGYNQYELQVVGASWCKAGSGPTPAPRQIAAPSSNCLKTGTKCIADSDCFFECPTYLVCSKCCVSTTPATGASEAVCGQATPTTSLDQFKSDGKGICHHSSQIDWPVATTDVTACAKYCLGKSGCTAFSYRKSQTECNVYTTCTSKTWNFLYDTYKKKAIVPQFASEMSRVQAKADVTNLLAELLDQV